MVEQPVFIISVCLAKTCADSCTTYPKQKKGGSRRYYKQCSTEQRAPVTTTTRLPPEGVASPRMGTRPLAAFGDVALSAAGRPVPLANEEDIVAQGQVSCQVEQLACSSALGVNSAILSIVTYAIAYRQALKT